VFTDLADGDNREKRHRTVMKRRVQTRNYEMRGICLSNQITGIYELTYDLFCDSAKSTSIVHAVVFSAIVQLPPKFQGLLNYIRGENLCIFYGDHR